MHGGRADDRKPMPHGTCPQDDQHVGNHREMVGLVALSKPAKAKRKRSKVHIDRRVAWSMVVGGQDKREMQEPKRKRAIAGRGRQQVAMMMAQVSGGQ